MGWVQVVFHFFSVLTELRKNLGNSPPKLGLLNHLEGVTDIPSSDIWPGESQV